MNHSCHTRVARRGSLYLNLHTSNVGTLSTSFSGVTVTFLAFLKFYLTGFAIFPSLYQP